MNLSNTVFVYRDYVKKVKCSKHCFNMDVYFQEAGCHDKELFLSFEIFKVLMF